MQLTSSLCLLVLLLCKTQFVQSRPGENVNLGRKASIARDPINATSLYKEEAVLLDSKWADVERIRFYEFQTITRRCKRYLLQHKPNIVYILRSSIDRLNDRNQCKTALDARKIVIEALEAWSFDLNAIVQDLRNSLLLISDVFITYFKLMVARCQIYFPPGATKFKNFFEEIIHEEKLLDINGEASKPDVQTLNNAVRYFSGVFNPAEEFLRQLEEIDAGDVDDAMFEEYLADAVQQIQTIGRMLMDIVENVEDTAYQGLKIYSEGMRIFKTHKAIFTNSMFRDKRKSVAEIEEFNEKIRLGIRLVKNIKSVDIMFGQTPVKGFIASSGNSVDDDNDGK